MVCLKSPISERAREWLGALLVGWRMVDCERSNGPAELPLRNQVCRDTGYNHEPLEKPDPWKWRQTSRGPFAGSTRAHF